MSATIYYQPVQGTRLKIGAPSSFLTILNRLVGITDGYGEYSLDQRWLQQLSGLVIGLETTDQREAVEELIDAIEKHGEVRVWAEY